MLKLTIVLASIVAATRPAPIVEQGSRVYIPARRTRVHFKEMDSPVGTYEFGYDTGLNHDRRLQSSYRYENRTRDGHVNGKYGYIAPDGILREVHYTSDKKNGFRTFAINRYPMKHNLTIT